MRVVVQRVKEASVSIAGEVHAAIGGGFLVLLGVEDADTDEDAEWLCNKLVQLRIFGDEAGLMNLSVTDIKGEILLISQFTLFAQTKKGNRPSFIRAAKPYTAIPIYEKFADRLNSLADSRVKRGIFGADMQVSLVNDGPVTIFIDTKNRE